MSRVLKISEIPEFDGAVFIEDRNVDCIEPCLYRYEQRPFFRFSAKDHAFGLDLATAEYEDEWRAWDQRPTEEERKETPWR